MASIPIDVSAARPTSGYGPRGERMHNGIDLAAPEGTAVFAYEAGPVRLVSQPGQMDGYGLAIVIGPHADGRFTLYAHLSAAFVRQGELVQEGQHIGSVGRTAGTRAEPGRMFGESGAHLHFELLRRWPPTDRTSDRDDPSAILEAWPKTALRRLSSAKVASGGGALLLLLAAFWYAKKRTAARSRNRRRQ